MFFLFGFYTNSNLQYLYFKYNSATLDGFVKWINAYSISNELWNYFQFNYTSV